MNCVNNKYFYTLVMLIYVKDTLLVVNEILLYVIGIYIQYTVSGCKTFFRYVKNLNTIKLFLGYHRIQM